MGAVIPTISVRAIETVGTAKAGLVSGITFMCQLAGAAVMLAINTVICASVGASSLKRLFASQNITLNASQNVAVEDVLRGAGSVHQLPRSLACESGDIADLAARAYADGLQVVLWFSAALLVVASRSYYNMFQNRRSRVSCDAIFPT